MLLEKINVSDTEIVRHTVSDDDIQKFATISGDFNPIHLDEDYAENTQFKKRIAHGMFAASFFSGIFGTKLPGTGCLYLSQNLRFKKPIFIGDELVISVCVIKKIERKRVVEFSTTITVEDKVVINGTAEIYIPKGL